MPLEGSYIHSRAVKAMFARDDLPIEVLGLSGSRVSRCVRTRRQHRFGYPEILSDFENDEAVEGEKTYALAGLKVNLFVMDMSVVACSMVGSRARIQGVRRRSDAYRTHNFTHLD
jgi:hypothetical protein